MTAPAPAATLRAMDTSHLGPLERAILRALTLADALGVAALDAERIWRCLPGYSTHRANVQAALDEPTALGRYLLTDGVRHALKDRPRALRQAADAAERFERTWQETSPTLRGLAKLPWVEGLALCGPWALGQSPAGGAPIQVALLAEGHRGRAAQAAFVASLRSRGAIAERIQLVATWDADAPVVLPDELAQLELASLQPITHPAGWAWLRARASELDQAFPNAPWTPVGPPRALADRLDGRLAALRRRLVGGDVDVLTADTRTGRRRLLIDRSLGGLVRRLAGDTELRAPVRGDAQARWKQVQGWTIEAGDASEPADGIEDIDAVEAPDAVDASDAGEVVDAIEGDAPLAVAAEGAPIVASRRRRGATKRPPREASPASQGTGRKVSRRGSGSASPA